MSFTFDMNGRLNRQSKANIEFSNTIAKAKPYVNFFNGCLVVASHPLVINPTNITQNSRVYVTRCCQLLNHVQEHYNVHSFCLCIIDGERFNMIRKWIGLYWLRWVERMGKEIQVSVHDVFRISKKFMPQASLTYMIVEMKFIPSSQGRSYTIEFRIWGKFSIQFLVLTHYLEELGWGYTRIQILMIYFPTAGRV